MKKQQKKVMKDPAKKKGTNRERKTPQPPLADKVREQKSSQEFAKALTLIAEAKILAKNGTTPHACAHTVYFAMYHCARAALLQSGGVGKTKDVPNSHEAVVQHFGNLNENGFAGPVNLGQVLNRARGMRVMSDYDLVEEISDDDATESVSEAVEFIEKCRSTWKLETITGGMGRQMSEYPASGRKLVLFQEDK
ncbi:HEPN domain-containing protein [Rhizobium leguminosarum]|uniref:HEPN domain-containing protein n=1 Tax=Rhizobium leguminosarum TaxID=384 RepID=UPI001C93CE86|nr:HEPN domain-containing protein [Rhizobium leguminosarum]MBY5667400.1 HEPN domain-containing protein [Rhizobium leguminosarum]MBY5710096.1 HEPN domain-containing protein [Rhizobium leguminosarum]MBY5721547.1 HEPN domain-containing protein [Rhizobium leguminosarum]